MIQFRFKNDKIKGLLKKKDKLVQEGRELSFIHEEIQEELNKLALKVQKVKDKVVPLVKKEAEGKLSETEEISSVDIDGEELVMNVFDVVEDYKANYLKKKYEQNGEGDAKDDDAGGENREKQDIKSWKDSNPVPTEQGEGEAEEVKEV